MECLEMFQLYDSGGHDLILKTNVKKWEYKLYGGRPEFYPQDRLALFTMLKFKGERADHDRKHTLKQAEMKKRLAESQRKSGA